MTNLVATTPITAKAMKSLYTELNRQKYLKRTYRRRYKDLQAVVAMSTDTPTKTSCPTIATSSKITQNAQTTKTSAAGQQKKAPDKGKAKPVGKGRKNPVKMPNMTTGPSVNLCSQLKDKAKHTAALIQEITEELQAIEEESANEEQESDATRLSDLEQEDSDIPLTEDEQGLCSKDSNDKANKQNDPQNLESILLEEHETIHTEEVIIGTEQGTTFPTRIGTSICNTLIDTGATKSCISERYYQK